MQKTVNQKLAFGVHGDLCDGTFPRAIDPYTVSAGGIGLFYTIDVSDPKKAILGGNGVLGGVAINSKEYIISGLGASLAFRDGVKAQLMSKGRVWLKVPSEITVGMAAYYNTTTGEIKGAAPKSSIEGCVEIPNSMFVLTNALAGEVAVLELR